MVALYKRQSSLLCKMFLLSICTLPAGGGLCAGPQLHSHEATSCLGPAAWLTALNHISGWARSICIPQKWNTPAVDKPSVPWPERTVKLIYSWIDKGCDDMNELCKLLCSSNYCAFIFCVILQQSTLSRIQQRQLWAATRWCSRRSFANMKLKNLTGFHAFTVKDLLHAAWYAVAKTHMMGFQHRLLPAFVGLHGKNKDKAWLGIMFVWWNNNSNI